MIGMNLIYMVSLETELNEEENNVKQEVRENPGNIFDAKYK